MFLKENQFFLRSKGLRKGHRHSWRAWKPGIVFENPSSSGISSRHHSHSKRCLTCTGSSAKRIYLFIIIYWVSQYFICMDFIQQLGGKNTENLIKRWSSCTISEVCIQPLEVTFLSFYDVRFRKWKGMHTYGDGLILYSNQGQLWPDKCGDALIRKDSNKAVAK